MFNTPYNRKIKDEMMAIDRAYITHSKKVSTKGLLNVSASGNKIGGALPAGMSPSLGRPIGGASSGSARTGGATDKNPRKASKWIEHVKEFAAKKGINYREALRDPECKKSYKKVGGSTKNLQYSGLDEPEHEYELMRNINSPPAVPERKTRGRPRKASPERAPASLEAAALAGRDKSIAAKKLAKELDVARLAKELEGLSLGPKEAKGPAVDRKTKPKGGARHTGRKFKQVGANIVAKSIAELNSVSAPTAATIPPKAVGGARIKGASDKKPRKPSKWVEHVKAFAAKKGVSYSCALSMPDCKAEYRTPATSVEAPKKKRLIKNKNI